MKLIPQPKEIHIKDNQTVINSHDIKTTIVQTFNTGESYRLTIDENGVMIESSDESGVYYVL